MIENFSQTIKLYLQLFILKVSPKELPYSINALSVFIILKLVIDAYSTIELGSISKNVEVGLGSATLAAIGSFVLSVLLIYTSLQIRKSTNRLHKVLLAIFAMDVLIFFISNILVAFGGILVVALMFWNFVVKAHIFRHGFSINWLLALFYAFSFELIRHVPFIPFIPLEQLGGT